MQLILHIALASTLSLVSQLALGDQIKNALLDLTCITEDAKTTYNVKADSFGSSLSVDGQMVHQVSGDQFHGFSAGTEGGDPYAQYVEAGFNVAVAGLDFTTAFYENKTFLNGRTQGSIWTSVAGSQKANCVGTIAFSPREF